MPPRKKPKKGEIEPTEEEMNIEPDNEAQIIDEPIDEQESPVKAIEEETDTNIDDNPESPVDVADEPPMEESDTSVRGGVREIDRRQDSGKRSIKEMDLKDEWKQQLIETELKKMATLPEGSPREAILVQYRSSPTEPLSNALIVHSRTKFMEAWEFYKDNVPDAKSEDFIGKYITGAGIDRSSYRRVFHARLDE